MKRILKLLVLVSLCQSQDMEINEKQLSAPILTVTFRKMARGVEMSWTKVVSLDEQDPVIGYRLNLWRLRKLKRTRIVTDPNSNLKVLIQDEYIEPYNPKSVPTGPIDKITATEETTNVTCYFPFLDVEVPYEVRMYAFTNKANGPMSRPIRFELDSHGKYKHDHNLYVTP